jgi:hypothetical protein
LTVLLLVCTLLLPVWSRGATALAAAALVATGAAGLRRMSRRTRAGTQRPASAQALRRSVSPRAVIDMVLYLSPVLLLTFAFPFAVARITDAQVAGVPSRRCCSRPR